MEGDKVLVQKRLVHPFQSKMGKKEKTQIHQQISTSWTILNHPSLTELTCLSSLPILK